MSLLWLRGSVPPTDQYINECYPGVGDFEGSYFRTSCLYETTGPTGGAIGGASIPSLLVYACLLAIATAAAARATQA